MRNKFPKAKEILESVIQKYGMLSINELHEKCYMEILFLKNKIYEKEISTFLKELSLPESVIVKIKNKILEPVEDNEKLYMNFLEKIVRPIVQAIQPIAGNIAELCVIQELVKIGLKENVNFKKKVERTDLIIYYPNVHSCIKKHRVEIKNVSLRERATRGLKFDGDSLLGFFNNPDEFTKENIEIIETLCEETGGYCYLPPNTLQAIKYPTRRFKSNTIFAKDMEHFCYKGILP